MTVAYVECAFRRSDEAFWVPILPTGIYTKDLGRAIKDRFELVTSDVHVSDPVTCVPYPGRKWIMPYEPVKVWITPLGEPPGDMCLLLPNCKNKVKTSIGTDESDDPDMPFHAVRSGRKPGIYMSKADMMGQVIGLPDAEYKTFASLVEANAYLQGGEGVGERELMSAGSRARHPPPKSTSPALIDDVDAEATASLGVVDAVFHCVLDPGNKAGFCVAAIYPSSNHAKMQLHKFKITNARNAARSELISSKLVLQACTSLPGFFQGRTLVRMYCMSTYATNAVNDYARNQSVFAGANASVMTRLATLVKQNKCRAFWSSSTDGNMANVSTLAIQLRLSNGEGSTHVDDDD